MANRTRKLLLTAVVVGGTASIAGAGVFAAFTAQTTNTGNSIQAGTVQIQDNSSGVAYYNLPNQGPGATTQRCFRVTYGGTLPATVKFYRTAGTLNNGTAFNLQVERGSGLGATPTFGQCTGFTAAATLYTGTLAAFPTTYAAAADARGSAWAQNDTVDYRLTVTVVDDPTPNAHQTAVSTGSHSFTWEARNN